MTSKLQSLFLWLLVALVLSPSSAFASEDSIADSSRAWYDIDLNVPFEYDLPFDEIYQDLMKAADSALSPEERKEFFSRSSLPLLDSLVDYVKLNLSLDSVQAARVDSFWRESRDQFSDEYYELFARESEPLPVVGEDSVVLIQPHLTPIQVYGDIYSRMGCFLVGTIIGIVELPISWVVTPGISIVCNQVMPPVVNTVLEELMGQPHFEDTMILRERLLSHQPGVAFLLGTAADSLTVVDTFEFKRDVWGMEYSRTLTLKTSGKVLVGFDLSDNLDIRLDHVRRQVVARIPAATVLAVEPSYHILDRDEYVMGVYDHEIHLAQETAKERLRERVRNRGILERAEMQALQAIVQFLLPVVEQQLPGWSLVTEIKQEPLDSEPASTP